MPGVLLFTPSGLTLSITVSPTTSSFLLSLAGGGNQARLKNLDATNSVFVKFGDLTITTDTLTGMPLGAGETMGVTLPGNATHIAAISSAGNPHLYVSRGFGA